LQAKNKAIVLLSGGLDSATVLAIAKQQGFTIHALSFDYGQRHKIELRAARRLAEAYGAQHSLIAFDLRQFGGSALTANIEVPKDRASHQISEGIPITYVPARNTIFLSFALGLAEVIGAVDIFVGVNALDYSGYPDCRPEFIAAFQQLANLATKAGVEGRRFAIHAPLIEMTKSQSTTRLPPLVTTHHPKAKPAATVTPASYAAKASPKPASPTPLDISSPILTSSTSPAGLCAAWRPRPRFGQQLR
jgi:7-cyano-7-deazaguanine synthase